MFRSNSFSLWLWHIDHEWTIWERNELIVVEPWQYPNWRNSWWVCDKAMQMVLWHRNGYDRRETAKFARNQLVCMSLLVGFVLFEGINHHWIKMPQLGLMVCLRKKQFCSTSPWIASPRLITHMKHLHNTCLAKTSSFVFSQQKKFSYKA